MNSVDANRGKEGDPESTEALLRAAGLSVSDANNLASLLQQQAAHHPYQTQQASFGRQLSDPLTQARALLAGHLGHSQSFGGATFPSGNSDSSQQSSQQQQQLSQAQAIQALLASHQNQALGAQSLSSLNRAILGGSLAGGGFGIASENSNNNNNSRNYGSSSTTSGGTGMALSSPLQGSQQRPQFGPSSQLSPSRGPQHDQQETHSQQASQTNSALFQSRGNASSSSTSDPSLQAANTMAQLASLLSGQQQQQSNSSSSSSSNTLEAALQNALLNMNQQNNSQQEQQQQQATSNPDQIQNLLQSTLSSLGLTGPFQQQLQQQQQPPTLQQSGLSLSNLQELQAQLQAQLQSQLMQPYAQQVQQQASMQQQQQQQQQRETSTAAASLPGYASAPQHASVVSAPGSFSNTATSSSNAPSSSNTSSEQQQQQQQQPLDQETEDILASIPPMPAELEEMKKKKPRGRSSTFPRKLHQMLTELEEQDGGTSIASFLLPHGRSFRIHKPKEFTKDIMPKYFQMSTFSSFQRQLNLYDFQRITEGPERDAYYHELFVRNQPLLCTRIKRNKLKGQTRSKQEERFQSYEKHKGGK